VQQRSDQPAHGAGDAEGPENAAIHVPAKTPEAQEGPDQMRH